MAYLGRLLEGFLFTDLQILFML